MPNHDKDPNRNAYSSERQHGDSDETLLRIAMGHYSLSDLLGPDLRIPPVMPAGRTDGMIRFEPENLLAVREESEE